MKLSQLNDGQDGRIIRINGGKKLRQKLALRGINEGINFKIISANGPVTLKTNGNTITIGKGMANKIYVRIL